MPKIVIKALEIDANPPLIEEENWNIVVAKTLKQTIKQRDKRRLAKYSAKCEFRTIEQFQREQMILDSKESERLLKVAILKAEYTYY